MTALHMRRVSLICVDAGQQERLYANTARSMVGVPDAIIDLALSHYAKISQQYADGIRSALKGMG